MTPNLIVLSSLFPSATRPADGVFVLERMRRVARKLPLCVVAPRPWFPLQGLIRRFRPGFRPPLPAYERIGELEVFRPRFLCFPGVLKGWDGILMALCVYPTVRRLQRERGANVLDAHFGYPDGYAGTLLARWLGMKSLVTFRGTETRHAKSSLRQRLQDCVRGLHLLIGVSDDLRRLGVSLGADEARSVVVGNGVDLARFAQCDRAQMRDRLKLPPGATVLISVGGLVERKGFHRVIEVLPRLLQSHPDLIYLVVGGASTEGDMSDELRAMVHRLGLDDHVRFCGAVAPDELKYYYSAADLFVLATRHEGWANVFLEAMACGLPVVTTRVGGNAEVVAHQTLGTLVDFGDAAQLRDAIDHALRRTWDRAAIRTYAESNSWDFRIEQLTKLYDQVLDSSFGLRTRAASSEVRTDDVHPKVSNQSF